jgi:hypothetical protein
MAPEQAASAPSRGKSSSAGGGHGRRHRRSWWRRFVRHARERYRVRTLVFYCAAILASLVVAYGVTRCELSSADSAPP